MRRFRCRINIIVQVFGTGGSCRTEPRCDATTLPRLLHQQEAKVFCFFSSEKKILTLLSFKKILLS
jgi:hypothetical protein